MHVERGREEGEDDDDERSIRIQPSRELLNISHEMMMLVLMLWTHQSRMKGPLEGDFEWLVMSYAAPAGGIMCMELLRRGKPGGMDDERGISKSEIIQQLSLFIGFLDWAGSNAPSGELCFSVKAVVRKVLDDSLNGVVAETLDAGEGGEVGVEDGTAMEDVGLNTEGSGMEGWDDLFSFELLDTFEWLRADA